MAFFLNTNVMINFFQNFALFWVKNAKFFAKFFGENIFKIITSVPDWASVYFWQLLKITEVAQILGVISTVKVLH
jgi:hypothetical protein